MSIRNTYPFYLLRNIHSWIQWRRRRFEAPSPVSIKRTVLLRNGFPDSTWIETGTYLGETTRFLAKRSRFVYSLEPEATLFRNAREMFKGDSKVQIIHGTSETVLPNLLPTLEGDVNFWLDGHCSAGLTFQGPQNTPIAEELSCIAQNLAHFHRVCVLIDDIRQFVRNSDQGYPPLDFLVAWAADNNFQWHIEHDIFVAKN